MAWEDLEFSKDCCATEAVAPDSMSVSVTTTLGASRRKGVEYEAANVANVANAGETTVSAFTQDGRDKQMVV